ncbi:MAG: hypothetical protein Q9217_000352 [Psora testacea]
MPSWYDEYLSALQKRDQKEKATERIYNTKLADKTAFLRARTLDECPPAASSTHPSPKPSDRKASRDSNLLSQSPVPNDTLARLRQDLSEAQRGRGLLEKKLESVTEELQKFKKQTNFDNKRIKELTKEKATLTRALGDRDEEIKGKAKLLEDVHDETVSLTLQLNMADERVQTLERENGELVERWMTRMGKEADEMNERSKFS